MFNKLGYQTLGLTLLLVFFWLIEKVYETICSDLCFFDLGEFAIYGYKLTLSILTVILYYFLSSKYKIVIKPFIISVIFYSSILIIPLHEVLYQFNLFGNETLEEKNIYDYISFILLITWFVIGVFLPIYKLSINKKQKKS